jgi:anti-sigma regulatory factor (Ser/Thr protein kinase)
VDSGSAPWGPSKGSSGFEVSLESVPAAGGEARRHLAGLVDRLPAAAFGNLLTVVSELVNNCVLHGSGRPIELSIEHTLSGLLRGTVSDGGMGPVEITSPGAREGGYGLRLVDLLASRWGVDAPSSDVWFEIAAQGEATH